MKRGMKILVQIDGLNAGKPFAVTYHKKVRGSGDFVALVPDSVVNGGFYTFKRTDMVPEGGF